MTATIVLIHSPLVGPTTWRWVADELTTAGHDVVVPTLVDAAATGSAQHCITAVADQINVSADDTVLVGHSGAGPLLPLIAAATRRHPSRLVFVDAGIPPTSGETALVPEDFAEHLRSIARDGLLPPWSDWFGPDTMNELIPDPARRRAAVADMPPLPLRYFDTRVTMPVGWSTTEVGAYILLSDPYRPDATEAHARGWPVVEMEGNHLDLVNRPAEVAAAIASLLDDGQPGSPGV